MMAPTTAQIVRMRRQCRNGRVDYCTIYKDQDLLGDCFVATDFRFGPDNKERNSQFCRDETTARDLANDAFYNARAAGFVWVDEPLA